MFPAPGRGQVKALACEMPAVSGTPLARWSCPELARRAAASGIAPAPSASTVRCWLADDALKPWQHQSWIFPRDPHFALKASRVLDLYQREWGGQPLGQDEYVLSADEKPGVQARMRIHLPLPPGPGRAMRAESEYHRFGTLAYLAAHDVHRAQVMGRREPTGRPRTVTDQHVEKVIAATLEQEPPNGDTRWSIRSMARSAGMSQSAVSRIWRAFGLKPYIIQTCSSAVVRAQVASAAMTSTAWRAGLAPAPVHTALDAEPAVVVMSRLPGSAMATQPLTAGQVAAVASIRRLHHAAPPQRVWWLVAERGDPV
jgi:hypothetical protein